MTRASASRPSLEGRPALAVVVISLRAPASLIDTVASLLAQDVDVEVVVVNSGGGHAAAKLAAAGLDVTVIEREERLLPGVARNVGIRATTAEYVAFLASDCRAAPGWAAKRLAKHRNGSAAVASALLPVPADSPIAWASHLSLFARRLPLNSRLTALPYGGSFHRSLFDSYGLFSEELRIGEDTEFARRLPLKARPVWAPEVVTLHETPTGLRSMLWDQFRRGRLASAHSPESWANQVAFSTWHLWRRVTDPIKLSRRLGYQSQSPVRRAWFLLPLCAAAYWLGVALPRRPG